MRIVLVNLLYSEKMGYADNGLAKALVRLGYHVDIVTSDAMPMATMEGFRNVYGSFLGDATTKASTFEVDGYRVHRLPRSVRRDGQVSLVGLPHKLRELVPDVVQAFSSKSWTTTELALLRTALGYRLFTSCHIHASVFPDAYGKLGLRKSIEWATYRRTVAPLVRQGVDTCFAISADAADIAIRFFGLSAQQVEVLPLAVDVQLFHPSRGEVDRADRERIRKAWRVRDGEIVCIYSGRFTRDKGPEVLARAVRRLRARGMPFRAVFIGGGREQEMRALNQDGADVVVPFVDYRELGPLYRAADIGVWPRQESTSQLDAAACGLPLVLSDQVKVRERVDGIGRQYAEGDEESLAGALAELSDIVLRGSLGDAGATRMRVEYSWARNARYRLAKYRAALAVRRI